MKKKFFQNKVIIITGSSSGIGKATALALGLEGGKVVINGRNPEKLQRAYESLKERVTEVTAVVADIASVEGAQQLIDATIEKYGKIDILINNAGMSSRGYFDTLAPQAMEDLFRINVLGCLYPTRAAIQYLKETRGSIIFISSVAGIRGLPETSLYCASKMALTSVAESLRVELCEFDVHVGIVYVGITKNDPGKQVIAPDGSLITLKQRDQRKLQSPEEVARSVMKVARKRKFKVVLSSLGKLNAVANVLFPRLVDKFLIRSKERIRRMNQ